MKTKVRRHRRKGRIVRAHLRRYKSMQPRQVKNKIMKNGVIYEPKFDGTRSFIHFKNHKLNRIINRRQVDTTERFPELKDVKIRAKNAVLDSEIVIIDRDSPYGDFKKLAMREHLKDKNKIKKRSKEMPAKIIAFDILRKEDKDIHKLPLIQRKRILNEVVPDGLKSIKEIPYSLDYKKLEKKIKKGKGEGIVAKELKSPYEQKKSNFWQKKKISSANDITILGYTKGSGKRTGKFGSLMMGVYDKGKWRYVGNVGTGFTDKELNRLTKKMKTLKIDKKPFHLPGDITWIKPSIVARVNYLRKTPIGRYREPRYIYERIDILPKQTHK